jgi:hypothetical protein
LTMGKIPRRRVLTGCRRRLPLRQASSHSCSIHLSHAEVGFRELVQSLFAVTCFSARSAMHAILPAFALPLYLTDGVVNGGGLTMTSMATMVTVATTKDVLLRLRLCFVLSWGGTPSKSVNFGGSSTLIFYTMIFL